MPTATTTAGKAEKLRGDGVKEVEVLLYDYTPGSANVKSAHMAMMLTVLPVLKKGGSLTVIGMASRFGSEARNQSISEQRARQVLAFLKDRGGPDLHTKLMKAEVSGAGTSVAKNQLSPAGSENERFRSVYIRAWIKSDPPPPPKKEDVLPPPDEFLKDFTPAEVPTSVLDIAGSWLDRGSALTGVAESVLLMAKAGTAAAVAGGVSTVLGVFSTVLGLFDSWMHGADLAKVNGAVHGFCAAMQDMANQYRDDGLDTTPLSSWPQLQKPTPHIGKDKPMYQAEAVEREAEQAGCDQAFALIRGLETNPREPAVKVAGKVEKVSGRILLRILWKGQGGHVSEYFMGKFNEHFKKTVNQEWPIRK